MDLRSNILFETHCVGLTWRALTGLTRESLSSLQHLLYVRHHDPLYVLELRVDAAQIPSRPAVNVRLLGFLDVGVWGRSGGRNKLTINGK